MNTPNTENQLDQKLQKAEADRDKLRKALIGLLGMETPRELDALEAAVRIAPLPDSDKAVTINAINAIRETV